MNEVTRIHIAKVAYDIEVTAKKELEKYIKSLEAYTQDDEVLSDIEIRMTELLAERKVAAGGVITVSDVESIRKQLGEPYEFADADTDGDIAVGPAENESRRLFRSPDDAVLGGVLSGMAAYFKVNPLWTRLIFILLTFISFGFSLLLYIVLWVIIPPARTAAEKLQLAGKAVTLESIRELNAIEETSQSRSIAPLLKRVLGIGLGIISILGAITTLCLTAWGVVVVVGHNQIGHIAESAFGTGNEYTWIAWLVFWIVFAGMLLLAALFSLVAYAFLAKKLTKRMIVAGIVIISLGVISAASAITITATQSWRVANEAQSLVQTTKLNLPKEFANAQSVVFDAPTKTGDQIFSTSMSSIQYVVDEGTPRYELTSLPKAKVSVKMEGQVAYVSYDIPADYRNNYVQPVLTIYGPALSSVTTDGVRASYSNADPQNVLQLNVLKNFYDVTVSGTFQSVIVVGKGPVDLNSSSIQSLDVRAEESSSIIAGTVRELTVVQPDVCPAHYYDSASSASLQVSGVTSGKMIYNAKQVPAETIRTSCSSVIVGDDDNRY